MKVSSSPRTRGCLTVARIASLLLLASATGACGDTREQEEARARRARQMRDVSRMLDAMEAADPAVATLSVEPPPTEKSRMEALPGSLETADDDGVTPVLARSDRVLVAAAVATTVSACGWAFALVWRRRRKATPLSTPPSIASFFAEPEPGPPEVSGPVPAPTWVYRSSPYETPGLEVVAEPVDLLLPLVPGQDAHDVAVACEQPPGHALREALAAADPDDTLHLVGDERFPDIRCTGDPSNALQSWHDILETAASAGSDDGRLARWLQPALGALRARVASRRGAAHLLDTAERQASAAWEDATGDERSHAFARWIRIRLVQVARLSGATRLFAVRDLLAHLADDPLCADARALDACIDVQLAWASWLLGDAATARLGGAERLCDRVEGLGPEASTLALRRRGEIALRHAQSQKPVARLPYLERAQALLDEAHDRLPDAETALLVAQVAQQRARLLPSAEAAAACSHALLHAFLAEQDPAWRIDALVCRLDIQLTYEALPEHAAPGCVTTALGRSLEAAGPVPPAARIIVAEARLHDGDYAGAASMCEAIWRDHAADGRVLDLWQEASRRWAADPGHDAKALAHALRRLVIARSTL